MTVCVAAIGNGGLTVFGAADRMITSGDVQFEPPQQKIWKLSDHIAVMVAEDVGIHAELFTQLYETLQKRLQKDAAFRFRVREASRVYLEALTIMHSERAERELLRPLGLTLASFIAQLNELPAEFSRKLANELREYPVPPVSAIFTGVDDGGTHIFVIEDGEMTCRDPIGFAAIGGGFWHANSHFMFARHTRFENGPRTLFRTYAAKKRAEVAPGVGRRDTDMFLIGGVKGDPYNPVTPDIMTKLQASYEAQTQSQETTENVIYSNFETEINQWIAAYERQQAQGVAPTQATAPTPPQDALAIPKAKPRKAKRGK